MTDETHVRDLYDAEARRNAVTDRPGARVERTDTVVRHVCPAPGWNGILWSDLREDTADAEIAAQVEYFAQSGAREFEWKLYAHDRPADLGARLSAAGLVPEPLETLMAAPAAAIAAEPAPPEGVRLVEVTDEAGVDLMMEARRLAFGSGSPMVRHHLLSRLTEAPDTMVAVVAMAGDRPVSAARMEIRPGGSFAGLWGGGTAPEWRGKGIYRALVAHRANEAVRRGVPYLQVDASSESRPILERLGFSVLGETTPYIWTSPS
ncbi:GNAT family N-acetyltransferase [Streptomyces bambusae]|uniref:GNAT family N-acetyltransferase n=1 Tax=Streptomyces bambusae TaxID=1550616 RepID=A0ABS6ZBR2_9ACTN|nr:GNAT family N-acetyltransferase [Streptomyces bambusae]MBW5485205.1 GNAT family N-acetyltransferase [Streptomyces bambusae]